MQQPDKATDYNASHDPLYPDVMLFVSQNKHARITSIQRKFNIEFLRAASLVEQLEKDGILASTTNSTTDDSEKSGNSSIAKLASFAVLFILLYGTMPIILSKVWFIFSFPVGLIVSLPVAGVLYLIMSGIKNTGKLVFVSIISIVLSAGISYIAKDYGDKLQAEIRKEEAAQKEAEFRARNLKELEKLAAIDNEREEYQKFLQTGESVATYQTYESNPLITKRRAAEALKRFAHDPSSVQDVQPLTGIVRVHVRGYPTCRYAITVEYRAKNALGGLVLKEGVVLLDRDLLGVAILERLP